MSYHITLTVLSSLRGDELAEVCDRAMQRLAELDGQDGFAYDFSVGATLTTGLVQFTGFDDDEVIDANLVARFVDAIRIATRDWPRYQARALSIQILEADDRLAGGDES